jgi:2-aminoadipate transaminase
MAIEITSWEHLAAARTRTGGGDGLVAILALANAQGIVSFAGGFPDPATFPGEPLSELMGELDASAFQYAPTAGLPGVRDFIAGRLERLEGLRPDEDALLITSGSIEALELCGKAFLEHGDTVVVEGPTYLGAIMSFESFEASVVAIEVDADGLLVDELERQLAGGLRPKLLYSIADYQNPAGVSLSAERREALVELARRYGFLVVEDVAYRELGFEDVSPPSMWSQAPDVVLQLGTCSKIFFPGVRLGWAAGPPEVVAKLVWAKQLTDQCSGALGQRLLEEYGRRGLLDAQIARARELYRSRCQAMMAALSQHLDGKVEWTRPRGGFFTWLTLPTDAVDLARRAFEAKVAFVPGAPFFPDGRGEHNARLSFSCASEDQIALGVERLAGLI